MVEDYPWHQWFYGVWESVQQKLDDEFLAAAEDIGKLVAEHDYAFPT